MIKNDANKCAKPVEIAKNATVPSSLAHHKPAASEVDNHNDNRKTNATNERSADVRPMSKIDIIKKFDGSNRTTSSGDQIDNEPTVRRSQRTEMPKYTDESDECENNENIENSNDDQKPNEINSIANNNHKCDDEYSNGNNEVVMPPKPLPRTSRNNSVSSLSSEYGFGTSANVNEDIGRPVAKPRTTTTNYKVQFQSHTSSLTHTHTHKIYTYQIQDKMGTFCILF